VCLRLLPEAVATRGHFPSDALKGGRAQIELECSDCNQTMNDGYEKTAQDFLKGEWGIGIQPEGRGRSGFSGSFKVEGQTVSIALAKTSARGLKELDAALAGVTDQSTLHLDFQIPMREARDRAFLAWSFLAWSHYAGYLYTASPGAAVVRRLVLDARQPLPATVVGHVDGSLAPSLPLPRPEPVILVKTIGTEIWGLLGVGMAWGSAIVALPFASDEAGLVYQRLQETSRLGPPQAISMVSIKSYLDAVQPKEITRSIRLTELSTGIDYDVTRHLPEQEAEDLVNGRSPYAYSPPPGDVIPGTRGGIDQVQPRGAG
jgi:hypothetical protein